jgi:hypothetical protein
MKRTSKSKSKKTSWLSNPIVHFFVLGAAIFGLHAALNIGEKEKNPWLVEVTSADIKWMRTVWSKQMQREPTAQELQNMIDSFIREEILYREAVAMGLNERNSTIRRLLAQKMEVMFKDLAEINTPTDDELQAYFKDHGEQYILPTRVSYTHIYFNADRRGKKAETDAKRVLEKLKADNRDPSDTLDLGDPFLLSSNFLQQSLNEVAREFGGLFAQKIISLQPDQWYGPVESAYGIHLVYIHERINSRMPELKEVREKVAMDLLNTRKNELNQKAYDAIRSRYKLLVEGLPYQQENNTKG